MSDERCTRCGHRESDHRKGGLCEPCIPVWDPSGAESECQRFAGPETAALRDRNYTAKELDAAYEQAKTEGCHPLDILERGSRPVIITPDEAPDCGCGCGKDCPFAAAIATGDMEKNFNLEHRAELEHRTVARPAPIQSYDLAPCMYQGIYPSENQPDVEALEIAPGAEAEHGWAYVRRDDVAALLTFISTALNPQKEALVALEGLIGWEPSEPSFHEIDGEGRRGMRNVPGHPPRGASAEPDPDLVQALKASLAATGRKKK